MFAENAPDCRIPVALRSNSRNRNHSLPSAAVDKDTMHRVRDSDLSCRNNLVMTMRNRFEASEAASGVSSKQQSKTLPHGTLARQLSDPVKVKRTPAFRCDHKPFERGHATSCREKKALKVSDRPSSVHLLRKHFDQRADDNARKTLPMALGERSNSSAEILLNRRLNQEYVNIAALYSDPIPKCMRPSQAIHNMSTLKLTDKTDANITSKLEALTDTLKLALKKPLPAGPAPQKPPRTFTHTATCGSSADGNSTPTSPVLPPSGLDKSRKQFAEKLNLNLQKNLKQRCPDNNNTIKCNRPDPKYMLEKLENALKNNKLRRSPRSASEERQKSPKKSPLHLNCLNSSPGNYNSCDRLAESKDNSPVTIPRSRKREEPVYAEPFVFLQASGTHESPTSDKSCRMANGSRDKVVPNETNQSFANPDSNRNSLHYMSTPITTELENGTFPRFADAPHRNIVDADTRCASQLSVNGSPPKIKELIKSFEAFESIPPACERVDKLEKQLRRALDQSFNDSTSGFSPEPPANPAGNNNNISDNEERSDKFETYVRSIRRITKLRRHSDKTQMFHCCLLVCLCHQEPIIKFKYPQEAKLPDHIEKLCFPDSNAFDHSIKAQNYSLVITSNNGERIYGYCRRVLPEDSSNCLPLAYCILSKNRAPMFYRRILEEIESRHGVPDNDRDYLLREVYCKSFPKPGESIVFQPRTKKQNAQQNGLYSPPSTDKIEIFMHQDARHKENDMEELCTCLDSTLLVKVFASLLLERKVVLLSCQLGRLSACIEALQNLLYPFSWPHSLIPVVPNEWWEIVEAPTPLICGALSVDVVQRHDINDAIVIDLDNAAVLQQMGDEMSILPACLIKEFKKGLDLARASGDNKSVHNVLLSDAFLRVFVHACGHYKAYLNQGNFDTKGFVQHPKKRVRKRFLGWFSETSMFSSFVDAVTSDANHFVIFDKRIQIYGAQDATVVLDKMREWIKD